MGITHQSIVDHPIDEVIDWHRRPGAFARLLPPWQPMRVVAETRSLESGDALLGLPLRLRWRARHRSLHSGEGDGDRDGDGPADRSGDASGDERRRGFVDDLVLPGLPDGRLWSHTHTFTPVDHDRTRITDHVDTPVPARVLRATFDYRDRQIADDLAAHARARDAGARPLTVAVTGATGLVGSALVPFLTTGGHEVVKLVRRPARAADERRWDPNDPAPDLLDGVDAVIHLAGAGIAGRFTETHKTRVRDSRIEPTRRLAELAARGATASAGNDGDGVRPTGPSVFVTASAIGFYGPDRGDEVLTEASDRGDGFLADLVADWEDATAPAAAAGIRTIQMRTGIVQSPRGGVLQIFRPLFAACLGGRLASGRQWMSWIGIDDLVELYAQALWDADLDGPLNAVAPEACRNDEYTRTLARVLRRPALLPVPAFGPRLLLGAEGASEFALASQRVRPARLHDLGHRFRHPDLHAALAHVLGKPI